MKLDNKKYLIVSMGKGNPRILASYDDMDEARFHSNEFEEPTCVIDRKIWNDSNDEN